MKRMEKCLLKSDVLTMENTVEEMVFQQRGKMLLINGVSAIGKMGKMKKMLLKSGVSAMGKRAKC
jgi:translation initiation factor IF-1